jgi:hypothetical protein
LGGDVEEVQNGGVEVAALGALGGPLHVVGRSGESGGGPAIGCRRRGDLMLVWRRWLEGDAWVRLLLKREEGREKGGGRIGLVGPNRFALSSIFFLP